MKRLLKRLLRPILPRWLVLAIRHRLEARLNEGEVLPCRVEDAGPAVRCDVAGKYSFLAPAECRAELLIHTDTMEGRVEFSGLAQAALLGGTMFDIGAHAGLVSALFCAAKPENKVYSFEPSPVSNRRLKDIQALNGFDGRMVIEQVAIGREKATLDMLIDPVGGYVQTQRFEHSMWGSPQHLQVPVESIPDVVTRLGVVPDFIKLDIEGFEYEAVEGAQTFFAQHQPVLLLELHLNYLEERGLPARRVVDILSGCGYQFFTYTGAPLKASDIYDSPLQSARFLARAR